MVWWWIADVIAFVVVVPLVVHLANRVIEAAREIERYADDILVHGVGLAGNLDPVPALLETQELVATATGHAASYASGVGRRLEGR